MEDNEEENVWNYTSLRRKRRSTEPREKGTKQVRAGRGKANTNTKKKTQARKSLTGRRKSAICNVIPVKEKPEGVCPLCQMPLYLLVVDSPRAHITGCADQSVVPAEECPAGVSCGNTFQSHYRRFSHATLALHRAASEAQGEGTPTASTTHVVGPCTSSPHDLRTVTCKETGHVILSTSKPTAHSKDNTSPILLSSDEDSDQGSNIKEKVLESRATTSWVSVCETSSDGKNSGSENGSKSKLSPSDSQINGDLRGSICSARETKLFKRRLAYDTVNNKHPEVLNINEQESDIETNEVAVKDGQPVDDMGDAIAGDRDIPDMLVNLGDEIDDDHDISDMLANALESDSDIDRSDSDDKLNTDDKLSNADKVDSADQVDIVDKDNADTVDDDMTIDDKVDHHADKVDNLYVNNAEILGTADTNIEKVESPNKTTGGLNEAKASCGSDAVDLQNEIVVDERCAVVNDKPNNTSVSAKMLMKASSVIKPKAATSRKKRTEKSGQRGRTSVVVKQSGNGDVKVTVSDSCDSNSCAKVDILSGLESQSNEDNKKVIATSPSPSRLSAGAKQSSLLSYFRPNMPKAGAMKSAQEERPVNKTLMCKAEVKSVTKQHASVDQPVEIPSAVVSHVDHPGKKSGTGTGNCDLESDQSRASSGNRRGQQKRQCPFYKKIPGTSFTVDAFWYGSIPGCTAYFLSHFHYDHYRGLNKSFQHPIYCSQITGNLVKSKVYVRPEFIHTIPLDKPTVLSGVEVTFLEANHCPGSVLILFKLKDGTNVLHTGDFRAHSSMEEYSPLIQTKIHSLYLDTTYCDPAYAFAEQKAVIAVAVSLVLEALRRNPQTLVVCGTYTIGKERVFTAVAKALESKIAVTRDKKKVLDCLEDPYLSEAVTLNWQEARVHVLPMASLNLKKLHDHLVANPQFQCILALQPTGWSHSNRVPSLHNIKPKASRNGVTIYGIPYSEHSSFLELKRFVQFVKADKILPTVNNGNPASRKKMEAIFKDWMAELSSPCSKKISPRQQTLSSFLGQSQE